MSPDGAASGSIQPNREPVEGPIGPAVRHVEIYFLGFIFIELNSNFIYLAQALASYCEHEVRGWIYTVKDVLLQLCESFTPGEQWWEASECIYLL